jgi:putative two-component system response regulator
MFVPREQLVSHRNGRSVASKDESTHPGQDSSELRTILVADDLAPNRRLLFEILTSAGFNVITAADGTEALRAVNESEIDLVLLDVRMPGKSGFEVCREIKERQDTYLIPVVLITGLSDRKSRIEGIRAGADDFLTHPVDRTELLARVRSLLLLKQRTDDLERAEAVLFTLAQCIEGKDPYTHGHCERISLLSMNLGKRLGLSSEQLTALRRGGIVHDIGKVAVPDAVLLKPGPLSTEEWSLMREHPVVGERICAPLRSFRLVLPIIRHHHEKWDGSGYPDRLRGEQIPITARVLQIVDIYDALTTVRPYKPAMSHLDAIRTMNAEGERGWWDTTILTEFERLLRDGAVVLQNRYEAFSVAQ